MVVQFIEMHFKILLISFFTFLGFTKLSLADAGSVHDALPNTFLQIAILLLTASLFRCFSRKQNIDEILQSKIFSFVIKGKNRYKIAKILSSFVILGVLADLLSGIFWGNVGVPFVAQAIDNPYVNFVAQFGIGILIFIVGLETKLEDILRVGLRGLVLAIVGAILPLLTGAYLISPLLFGERLADLPGDKQLIAHLFVGAVLSATSIGLVSAIFKEQKAQNTKEFNLIKAIAVIDDILGIILLVVLIAMNQQPVAMSGAEISILAATTATKSIVFLVAAVVIGVIVAPLLGKLLPRIHPMVENKIFFIMCWFLVYSALAQMIGLEFIIGSFAAGLVLEHSPHLEKFFLPEITHSLRKGIRRIGHKVRSDCEGKDCEDKETIQTAVIQTAETYEVFISSKCEAYEKNHHIEIIENKSNFFTPIFFAYTGLMVKLDAFLSPASLFAVIVISLLAIATKYIVGPLANIGIKKDDQYNPSVIGWGLVPRAEVGLVMAYKAIDLELITPEIFSCLIGAIVITTFVPPFFIVGSLQEQK